MFSSCVRGSIITLLALMSVACLRSPEYYVNRGNQLAKDGKYAEAELNYRNALKKNVKYGDAYYQLALNDLKMGKVGDAYRHMGTAVQLMPNRDDVKVKMADLSFSLYLADPRHPQAPWQEAVKLADQLLEKNPKSFDALRLEGHLAASEKKLKEAEDFYYRASAVKPMDPEVTLGLVQVIFQQGRARQAEDLAMALIAKTKTYGPIYDWLAQRRLEAKDLPGAEQILKSKHLNNPSDVRTSMELARFYAGTSREADMKAVLQELLDNPKRSLQAPLEVGDFYLQLRRLDDARKQYEEGIQASSAKNDTTQRVVYLKRIVDLSLIQGKQPEAEHAVDEILKVKPDEEDVLTVKASLLIASRKPENISKAVSLLQPQAAKHMNNAALHYTLARALAAKGDLDAARPEFLLAVQKNPRFIEPRLALAEMGQLKGDYQTVLRYANEILGLNPNLSRVKVLRAVSLINTGDSLGGRKELTALEKAYPQDKELQLQLGLLELHDRHFKEAEEYFRKLNAEDPGNVRPLSGLTQTLAAEGQLDKAVTLLQEEVKKAPKNDNVRYLYAVAAGLAGNHDVSIAEFQHLVASNPQSAQLYLALGNAYRLKGDVPNALSTLQKGAELAPKDPAPMIAVADTLTSTGRDREALDKYRAALHLNPNNAALLNNVAYLLAETGGSLEEALNDARRAIQLDNKQPRFNDTLGWIYFKQNLNESALQVFRGLTTTNPDNATFHYHFAMVLLRKGDKTSAKTELQNALSKKPSEDIRHSAETELSKLG